MPRAPFRARWLWWGSGEKVLEVAAAGHACLEPDEAAVARDTLFDLASLTKPLCAGALAAIAGDALPLDAAPGRYLPEWKQTRFDGIRIEHLLTHTSGLAAWYPMYTRGEGAAAYRRTLATMEPQARPGEPGRLQRPELPAPRRDPGDALHRAASTGSSRSSSRRRPARAPGSFRRPAPTRAATEKGDRFERAMVASRGLTYAHFRDGVVRGEVHDGNALRRGGVAASAGSSRRPRTSTRLRATLARAARAWTRGATARRSSRRRAGSRGRAAAARARPIPEMSPRAFGHTGFTGTSLWIDPDRELISILLTNRIHPEVREIPFNEVRQRFHAAVYGAYA